MLLDKLQEPHRSALARVRRSVTLRARRGWRASLLGGAVRDLVTGRQPHDLDFVLEGVESKDALHVWATLLADGVLDDAARVIVTALDGLRFEVDSVGVDAWRVEDPAIGAGPGRHHETIARHATGAKTSAQTCELAHATTRAETGLWCGEKVQPRRCCGSTGLVAWRGHFGSVAGRLDQTPATCEGPGHAAVRHAQGTITTGPAREGRAPLVRRACRGLSLPSRGTQAGPSAGAC